MPYYNLDAIKAANEKLGHYWFQPATMRFFRTRLGRTVYGGRYFITSEQFERCGTRAFTIRKANDDGSIDTIGDFEGWATRKQAEGRIRNILKEGD